MGKVNHSTIQLDIFKGNLSHFQYQHHNKPESEELSESLPAPPKNFDIVTTFQHSGIAQELNILFKLKERTQIKPLGNAFDMRIN